MRQFTSVRTFLKELFRPKNCNIREEKHWSLVPDSDFKYHTPYSQMADTREKTGA